MEPKQDPKEVQIFKIRDAKKQPKRATVVFFHGLNGDPYKTWGATDKDHWPWLKAGFEDLSVYSVRYRAPILNPLPILKIFKKEGPPPPHFFTETNDIYKDLLEEPKLLDRPLYLIGHSLGGLVIKQLIRTAESKAFVRGSRAKQFLKQVKKIVFLATPHRGSPLGSLADSIPIFCEWQSATMDDLDLDNPHLVDLHQWYRNWANSRKIPHHLAMYEMKAMGVTDIRDFFDRDTAIETVFGLLKPLFEKLKKHSIDKLCGELEKRCPKTDGGVWVVKEGSANPEIDKVKFEPAYHCNHIQIAKPEVADSPVYQRVCDFLRSPPQSVLPWRPRPA